MTWSVAWQAAGKGVRLPSRGGETRVIGSDMSARTTIGAFTGVVRYAAGLSRSTTIDGVSSVRCTVLLATGQLRAMTEPTLDSIRTEAGLHYQAQDITGKYDKVVCLCVGQPLQGYVHMYVYMYTHPC